MRLGRVIFKTKKVQQDTVMESDKRLPFLGLAQNCEKVVKEERKETTTC